MPVHYPFPWMTLGRLLAASLGGRRLSFRAEARRCIEGLRPPLEIIDSRVLPPAGPYLLTINHYACPGFRSWWLALAASAAVPVEIHWVITSAWEYAGFLPAHTVTPLSRWALRQISRVYGFTTMPPAGPARAALPAAASLPPPVALPQRASAVRRVLAVARHADGPVIGLAPEGRDHPQGILQDPPPGAGRFMLKLAALGLLVLPAGLYETSGRLCLRFGPAYCLEAPPGLSHAGQDAWASRQVMTRIAALLPPPLRGGFEPNHTEL